MFHFWVGEFIVEVDGIVDLAAARPLVRRRRRQLDPERRRAGVFLPRSIRSGESLAKQPSRPVAGVNNEL